MSARTKFIKTLQRTTISVKLLKQQNPHLPASLQSRDPAYAEPGGRRGNSGRVRFGDACLRPGSSDPSSAAGPGADPSGCGAGGEEMAAAAGVPRPPGSAPLGRPRAPRQAGSVRSRPGGFVFPARRTLASGRKVSSAI